MLASSTALAADSITDYKIPTAMAMHSPDMSAPGLILLAAGGSARMGRPKQLLRFQGRSLLARAAGVACASGCAPIVAVLGADADVLIPELERFPGVLICSNPNWAAGMGSSLRAGLQRSLEADPKLSAAVILLCDQPHVAATHLRRLCEVFTASGKGVIATEFSSTFGPPCLFAARWFDRLRDIPDAHGAKPLLMAARLADDLATVELAAAEVDVDTPEDYARLTGESPSS